MDKTEREIRLLKQVTNLQDQLRRADELFDRYQAYIRLYDAEIDDKIWSTLVKEDEEG